MAVIEKFLGRSVEIPEDRLYDPKSGVWAQISGQEIVFGLSRPALILIGGINDLEWLASNEQKVEKGETVMFAITGKILYLDTPVSGTITFNPDIKASLSRITEDPYGGGWLFRVKPAEDPAHTLTHLADAAAYVENLKSSEGCKNPEGLKGGVSGICKAVYSGIREQKIS